MDAQTKKILEELQKQVNVLSDKLTRTQNELDSFKNVYYYTNFPDRVIFNKNVDLRGVTTFAEGSNIMTGTTTGTKIGTASTQKIGFYGVTPVAQQSAITAPTGGATVDAEARTAIVTIISRLQTVGLTA